METKNIKLCELDNDTKKYLRSIYTIKGKGYPGVFKDEGGRKLFFMMLGIVVVIISLYFYSPTLNIPVWIQVPLFALGVLLIAINYYAIKKTRTDEYIGEFVYIDGSYFWKVDLENVEYVNLDNIDDIDAVETTKNGSYQSSKITLKSEKKRKSYEFNDKDFAQELSFYLLTLIQLKKHTQSDDSDQELKDVLSRPNNLSAATRNILNDMDGIKDKEILYNPDIPVPTKMKNSHIKSIDSTKLGYMIFAGALLLGGAIYYPISNYVSDEYYFSEAKSMSETMHTPAYLRNYLGNPDFGRHKEEAETLISGYYDEAIEKLQLLASGKNVDKELFGGLLAILEYLKKNKSPVVSVLFVPHVEADNNDTHLVEKFVERIRSENDDTLRAMIKKNGTAIIPPGATFDDINVLKRQGVILDRVSEAFSKVLSNDIISFDRTDDKNQAILKIAYHIKPSGSLFKYTSESETKGLLKSYEIVWDLSIKPSGNRVYKYHSKSNPNSQLKLWGSLSDPDWAPYAVIIASAFYDFSNNIIKGFGLTPPPAPEAFTFSDVVGRSR